MTTVEPPPLRLTDLTSCGGCAAKLGADVLAEALAGLRATAAPPQLIVGLDLPDDAAAFLVAPELAILGTVDFFPPLVDDPAAYGEIAAANALSDVFAMGGRVLFALSVAAFPEDLPRDSLVAILEGAAAKVREAGGTLAGGHTIRDPEPKFGLAVVGAAHPDHLLRKGGARPGDVLLLTKRLGTGIVVSGQRQGRTAAADLATAIDQMRTLNRAAGEALVAAGIRGATDVTGFGILGHGLEMARARARGSSWTPSPAGAAGRARPHPRRRRDRWRRPQPALRRARPGDRAGRGGRIRDAGPRSADERRPAGSRAARRHRGAGGRARRRGRVALADRPRRGRPERAGVRSRSCSVDAPGGASLRMNRTG